MGKLLLFFFSENLENDFQNQVSIRPKNVDV